ncbi:hypothetical protein ACFYXS_19215 [Streptomyces sp. NPDC002574]|uniref:hypothetical protein n=1 Tax=Streptomyces sp. NPDC002574 TaxID=3364652 RepID=UPI0036CAC209
MGHRTMFTSRRRTAVWAGTLAALTCLALSACSGADSGGADRQVGAGDPSGASAPAAPSAVPSTPGAPSASGPVSPVASVPPADAPPSVVASVPPADAPPSVVASVPPADAARWAGTKQFVQMQNAWTTGGRTYLSVRSARKQAATGPIEAWEIVPGRGPYTTVPLAADGRLLLSVPLGDDSVPASYSAAEFVKRLRAQSPSFREGLGYDLSFDAQGRVVRLQSLYTP